MARRPQREIVITAASQSIRLERNRPTWDLEAEADIDPPPGSRTEEPKRPSNA